MAVGERERRELQEALVGTIGPEPTDTLLSYLPPVGWADVATKRDLDNFAAQLRLEMAEMKTELRTEVAGVRAEIADLRTDLTTNIADLHTEISGVRTDLRTEIADLRTEGTSQIAALRSDLTDKLNSQLRWLVGLVVLVVLTVVGTGVLTR